MKIVECAFGLFQDFGQTFFTLRIPSRPLGRFKRRFHQRAERPEKSERFRSCRFTPVSPAFSAFPSWFDGFFFAFEFAGSFRRQSVGPPAILSLRLNHSFVLELLQCRVNGPGAGAVQSS